MQQNITSLSLFFQIIVECIHTKYTARTIVKFVMYSYEKQISKPVFSSEINVLLIKLYAEILTIRNM